jgi:acetyl-CoA acetyltransferase
MATAILQAVETAGLEPSRVQDVVLGSRDGAASYDLMATVRAAGLNCPSVSVSSALRAVYIAAEAILSGDLEVSVVASAEGKDSVAMLVAGSEAIGRWNLMPRARLAARSLSGAETARRRAGIAAEDVKASREGDSLALLNELLDEMGKGQAQWGIASAGEMALLIEDLHGAQKPP